jgi:opacity protein-like surface antigen
MGSLRLAALAAAINLAALPLAYAADYPEPPPPVEKAPWVIEEFGSNWYLRGDVGASFNRLDGVAAIVPTLSSNIDDTFTAGGGFGYKAGWFRGDITVDYGGLAKSGGVFAPTDLFSARIDTITGLFNLYFDLGTWYGFTPYVGGGVGAAYVRTTDFTTTSPVLSPLGIPVAGTDTWNFAWALMAGASFGFTPNFLLDVGYRYLNVGDAESKQIDPTASSVKFKDITAHQVRVGVRYVID